MSGEGDSLEITVDPNEPVGQVDDQQTGAPEQGGLDEQSAIDLLNELIGNQEDLEVGDEEYDYEEEGEEYDYEEGEEPSELDSLRQQLADMQAQQITNSVYDNVGGQQNYERMVEWAAGNLNEQEQGFYDQVMASNDPAAIQFAVNSLKTRYDAAFDQRGNLNFSNTGGSQVEAFTSMTELADAMDSPRYQTDEAYRTLVERRAAISNIGLF